MGAPPRRDRALVGRLCVAAPEGIPVSPLGTSAELLPVVLRSAPLVLFAFEPSGQVALLDGHGLSAAGLRPGRST